MGIIEVPLCEDFRNLQGENVVPYVRDHGHPKKTKGRRLPERGCQLFSAQNELIAPACFTLSPDHAAVEKACLKGHNLSIIKAKRVCPVL